MWESSPLPAQIVGTTSRTRTAVAVVCMALVVCAALIPAVAANLVGADLTPLGLVLPAVAVTLVRRRASRCEEQPVSLRSLLPFRAPPLALA